MEIVRSNEIIKLTASEVEKIYRKQELKYRKQDAMIHLIDHYGEIQESSEIDELCKFLAERFLFDYYDCNIAENITWDQIIYDYKKDIEEVINNECSNNRC